MASHLISQHLASQEYPQLSNHSLQRGRCSVVLRSIGVAEAATEDLLVWARQQQQRWRKKKTIFLQPDNCILVFEKIGLSHFLTRTSQAGFEGLWWRRTLSLRVVICVSEWARHGVRRRTQPLLLLLLHCSAQFLPPPALLWRSNGENREREGVARPVSLGISHHPTHEKRVGTENTERWKWKAKWRKQRWVGGLLLLPGYLRL